MKADLAGYLSMPAPGAPAGGVHRRIRLLGMLAEWVGRYSAPVAATAALAAAGLAVHRSGVESPPPPPPVRQPTVVSESEAADRLLLLGRTYEIRSRSGAAMRLHVQEVRLDARAATVRVSDTNGVDHTLTLALEEKRQAVLSTGRHWIKLDGVADNGALFSFAMQ
jgi:hypothetical protein